MKELPILFNGEMVRAVLDGRKTQTRRVIKPQPERHHWEIIPGYKRAFYLKAHMGGLDVNFYDSIPQNPHSEEILRVKSRYEIGDRLWVRETWQEVEREYSPDTTPLTLNPIDREKGAVYRASQSLALPAKGKWKPSIFMPRWAARIFLEVTDVKG